MFTVENFNIAVHISALIITSMVLMGVMLDGNISERIHRCFFAFLILNLTGILSEFAMAFLLMAGISPSGTAIRLLDFLSYLVSPLQNIAFALYLYEYLGIKTGLSRKPFYLSVVLSFISVITLVFAQLRGLYGCFSDDLSYVPGELNSVYYLTSALFTLVFIYIAYRYGGGLRIRERVALLSYPLIILSSYAIEGIFSTIWISYLGVSLVLFVVYINIQGELKQQLIRKDAELADQRIAIMLSQIRPHFLYNSLSSIENLCDIDIEKTKTAINDFAHYLRGNLESIGLNRLIPFEDELEHVETYLSLEKLRFGDKLNIVFDIEPIHFSIPPLTIQPIVENAVRHGITKKGDGGTVIIRGYETEQTFIISVEDNGIGFEPDGQKDDGRIHIGIQNVQERLLIQRDGTLEIQSKPGDGTKVVITIPKRKQEASL